MAVTEKQKQVVLDALEQGYSLRQACEQADIPNNASVLHAAESDPDGFGLHYAHARQAGYMLIADRIRETAADMSIPADHKRIMVDTDKWMLAKMLPKVYGDKLDLTAKVSSDKNLSDAELIAIAARATGGDVK